MKFKTVLIALMLVSASATVFEVYAISVGGRGGGFSGGRSFSSARSTVSSKPAPAKPVEHIPGTSPAHTVYPWYLWPHATSKCDDEDKKAGKCK